MVPYTESCALNVPVLLLHHRCCTDPFVSG